jgi:predicted permease
MRRFLFLFRRKRFDLELQQEMQFHLEQRTRQLREQGIDPLHARQTARREFGNMTLLRDASRDVWVWEWIESSCQDLRFGLRGLAKTPGFTAIVIAVIALGIGANTAIFSMLNAVLLRKLPVTQPEQLVWFGDARAAGSTGFMPSGSTQLFSYPFFREFRRTNQVFSDVAAIGSILFTTHGRVAGGTDFEKINVELVSGTYFHSLGIESSLGRLLTADDDLIPGGHPVAVASQSWWRGRFGALPSAVGATVTIGSTVYVIVGVTPPGFSGATLGQSPDLWIPLAMQKEISPGWHGLEQNMFQTLHIIARLKPGIEKAQAAANTNLVFRQILRSYIGSQPTPRQLENIQRAHIDLTPALTGRGYLREQFSSPLKILMVVVALVLFIACANVANLFLARASVRQREIAIRMSLGSGRMHYWDSPGRQPESPWRGAQAICCWAWCPRTPRQSRSALSPIQPRWPSVSPWPSWPSSCLVLHRPSSPPVSIWLRR